MAGAERGISLDRSRRETHHQQRVSRLFLRVCNRRGCHVHQQLMEMLLIKGHPVGSVIAAVCFPAQLAAYCYLGGQADDSDSDSVVDKGCDGLMDVTGV